MEKRNSFVFKESWLEALNMLHDGTAFELHTAICNYAAYGIEPELSTDQLNAIFTLIRREIDENNERYEETCEKRRRAVEARWSRSKKAIARSEAQPEPCAVNQVESASETKSETASKTASEPQNKPDDVADDNAATVKSSSQTAPSGQDVTASQTVQIQQVQQTHQASQLTQQAQQAPQSQRPEAQSNARFDPRKTLTNMTTGEQWRKSLERFCADEHITLREFKELGESVISEWELKGITHTATKDGTDHLISAIRIKNQKTNQLKNNNHGRNYESCESKTANTGLNKRRGVEPTAKSWLEYKRAF